MASTRKAMSGSPRARDPLAVEEWRSIPDHGDYEASSLGRIRRAHATNTRPAGSILKTKPDRHGYLKICLSVGGRPLHRQVHRLVCLAFHGLPPTERHEAAHRDGIRTKCEPDNLRWATHAEQIADRDEHGRYWHVVGEDHPMRVLNDALVIDLRQRWQRNGTSIKALAREVGHAYLTIYDAVKGRTWRHLPN
jgi:hypothetical protein